MSGPPPVYCIDTSSVLVWFVDTYPPTIFPGLLARIEGLIDAERLCAPKAVLDEIRPGDDCHKWAKAQTTLFLVETVAVQRIVRQLMATHHDPSRPTKGITVPTLLLSQWRRMEGRIVQWWPTSIPVPVRTEKFLSSVTMKTSAALRSRK